MTSKNLFFKLVRQDFKKRIWCPILIFIAYFLALEVYFLMEIEAFLRNPHAYSYDIVTLVKEYFFGRQAVGLSVITCCAAFLCGISGYIYLHSKAQLDLYHSLPVSRSQLFVSKYLSGILQFFIPFVFHTLVCVGIAAGRGAFTVETVSSVLSYIGLQLVIFVLAYSVSVVAVGLTGNMIISILGTGVLFGYSTIIAVLTYVLADRFFLTYITYGSRIKGVFNEKIWCFSPLSMIMKLFSSPNNTTMEAAKKLYKYDTSYVWVMITAAVVYSLAAYFVYLKRASEAAGKTIAFRAAEPVIKTLVVIPFSFFVGIFFSEISYDSDSDGWFLFGLIVGFVILCILMEIIFRQDLRGALMHKKQFLFNAACTMLIFVLMKYDVTGYDTYVPADAQLQSCAVSINQLMPMPQSIRLNDFGYHFLSADEYRMANMEIQANPSAMELARKAAKEKITYQYFDYYEGIEESPEYMEVLNRQENYRYIYFGFKLMNGRTIYREYIIDIADTDTLGLLADIFDDYDYKIGSTPVLNDSWNVAFDAVLCESNFKMGKIELTPDVQAKLVEAYQKEYTKLTLDTVMHVIPVGTIDFVISDRYDSRSYSSYSGEMYVYPQFTETIALLRECGFDMEEKLTADDIESISVQKNTYDSAPVYYVRGASGYESTKSVSVFSGTEDENVTEYTDKEQIQQILDSAVSDGFSWQISSFADFWDRSYTIDIRCNAEDAAYCRYSFIKGQIPEFIQ